MPLTHNLQERLLGCQRDDTRTGDLMRDGGVAAATREEGRRRQGKAKDDDEPNAFHGQALPGKDERRQEEWQ